MKSLQTFGLALALSAGTTAAWADSAAASSATETPLALSSSWSLGLGVASTQRPYAGAASRTRVLPLLQYENAWVRVFGPRLDLKLPKVGAVDLAVRAQFMDEGYEASDSPFLAGMAERKSSAWIGLRADWPTPVARLGAEWMADASGHSKGQQARLVADRLVRLGPVGVAPRVGLVWQSDKLVDYLYGVRATEAREGRAAYEGKATLNTELGVRVLYGVRPAHSVYLDLSSTALGSGIKDSPLVDRQRLNSARLGYLARF